ncbi:hypothetical protein AB0B66_11885 [Catellatospora sp. NPDC049111]
MAEPVAASAAIGGPELSSSVHRISRRSALPHVSMNERYNTYSVD